MSEKITKVTYVNNLEEDSIWNILNEFWRDRNLIWVFVKREIQVKYFQTILGPLWIILTPLVTVGIMTIVFGLMVKIPSDGVPYLLFYLIAVIPWYAFTAVLNQTASTLESQSSLFKKIYFSRLVIPMYFALSAVVDFLSGFILVILVSLFYSLFTIKLLFIMPLLLCVQMMWALGLGLLLAPLYARYRDVKHLIPLGIQLYYFANPIMYSVSITPHWVRWIYIFNPLSVVINTYRATFSGVGINWFAVISALLSSMLLFILGSLLFVNKAQKMMDIL